jgi:dCMP deaminase
MPDSTTNSPTAVNVYVDGYNFYYSISKRDEPELLPLGWCNFCALADRLAKKLWRAAHVGAVKYYTARVPQHLQLHIGEVQRQQLWLDALRFGTKNRVHIIEGYYAPDNVKPRVEKKTDISLAISMVRDSIMSPTDNRHSTFPGNDPFSPCDGIILISADKDFHPAAQMVGCYGTKVAIFRPLGFADTTPLVHENIQVFDITEEDLQRSRLPDRIERDKGSAITWSRYCELKAASKGLRPKVAPPDPAFDRQCLEACRIEGTKSIDKDTRVGCIVVGPERNTQIKGHNALPYGIAADPPERLGRPDKYTFIEHAERNAIYAAARCGISLEGCSMYVELMPCVDCARGIIQAGLWEVVVSKDRMQGYSSPTYREQHLVAASLLKEAGVILRTA